MVNDPSKGEIFKVDVTCLRGDELSRKIENGEEFTVCDEFDRYKSKTFEAGNYQAFTLQKKVIENGVNIAPTYTLAEKKAFCPSARRLINPHYYKVDISDDLYNLKMGIINRLVKEIKDFKL